MNVTKNILVIEDEAVLRGAIGTVLRWEGYSVEHAGNGQEAIDRLRQGPPPRLILLDLKLPLMDGYEFLDEKGRDRALAPIPVVVVSGADEPPAGVEAFVRKPVDIAHLLETIKRHL